MNNLEQYILRLENLIGKENLSLQGNPNDFLLSIWLEICVAFRFISTYIWPFLLAFVPAALSISIYYLIKYTFKIDKTFHIFLILSECCFDNHPCDPVFMKERWKKLDQVKKNLLISQKIPLDIKEDDFLILYNKYKSQNKKCRNIIKISLILLITLTTIFYILAAYPYYLLVGDGVMGAVIIVIMVSTVLGSHFFI